MATIDVKFKALCEEILNNGKEYENKNRGVKRLQIPSYTIKHNFSAGFPAITNKKIYWKGVVAELLWFLRGQTNISHLHESNVHIWDKDAKNWEKKTGIKGDVGKNYSYQWRSFNGDVDQISELIENMQVDIMSSRLVVNAWNPSEINDTALPPCHTGFQIVGEPTKNGFGFYLVWEQRSVDTFLGLPFNIASYALLAKILEKITGFEAIGIIGNLKCVHFYDNQYEAVKKLLERSPFNHSNCELLISDLNLDYEGSECIDDIIYNLSTSDFKLSGYTSDDEIKVEMLAPKGI